jgi:hypothetical protein
MYRQSLNHYLHWSIGAALLFALFAAIPQTAFAQYGVADGPWTMYRRDPAHTGRSSFLGPMHQPVVRKVLQFADANGTGGGLLLAADDTLYASLYGTLYAALPYSRTVVWEAQLHGCCHQSCAPSTVVSR